jgi:hypothetical protein
MEQGSKTLLIILGVALLMGALVIGFNPAYRQAFLSLVRGQPAESPIWKSNLAYYPDVTLPTPAPAITPALADPEARHDAE